MPNLANIDNPTEDQEQEAFVQWLRLKGYPHFRVPNETYTRSWSQKAKNKKLGVSSGVPDLAVVVPGCLGMDTATMCLERIYHHIPIRIQAVWYSSK